jgi:hypothetical protein
MNLVIIMVKNILDMVQMIHVEDILKNVDELNSAC